MKEAEAAKAAMTTQNSGSSAELRLNQDFFFAREQERDLFVDAFRRLGLPVCATPEELANVANPVRLPECETEREKVAAGAG